jgi:hypothetical protein
MPITSNFASFDLTLYTNSAFSESFEVKYEDANGNWISIEQTGKTFTMQLRKDPADASAAATITVRPHPTYPTFIEIYGAATALNAVAAGRYHFAIVDTTAGASARFVVATGMVTIIQNPNR